MAMEALSTAEPLRLELERTREPVAERARLARTWRQRMVGLLAHRRLPVDEALMFPRCNSIHTVGMRFPIDAIFVDRGWRVVAVREGVAPGRLMLPVWRAWGVVEAAAGTVQRVGLRVGDRLVVIAGTT
jgi:uncharacterized membrane protein (UPF0127 family)